MAVIGTLTITWKHKKKAEEITNVYKKQYDELDNELSLRGNNGAFKIVTSTGEENTLMKGEIQSLRFVHTGNNDVREEDVLPNP